ncbi:MAG TPA: Asp23/Gls24 family envelope stress response protein [Anaerolineales bacterium]|nr:Asp23/Gls24 family envelope stress response protein [Anaerolineales bacterium]
MSDSHTQGKTTVSPDVLVTIAKLSALSVPGVSRMAHVPGGVNRLFKRGFGEGVRIEVQDNVVVANLYLILKQQVNIREVSRNVQHQVARALQEMVGMDIGEIEIHIEDIDLDEDPEARSA